MSDHDDGTGRADGPSSEIRSTQPDIAAAFHAILARLDAIEQRVGPPPPTVPLGRPPFRGRGKPVSAVEYEARTGIPRVAAALALHLLQYSQARIAERIGVNRRTLQIGEEFKAYRDSIVAVRAGSGLARQRDDEGGDE